ncbi:POZ domain-containing protein [Polyplosphaeria fusca]|uniref:Elongin-C n=1 Tax=Polyplosphaeria fusca TaxID=682080 RepID=A0A9P4QLW3_9PLEO|nr:POZ domain-containing protein [Polyplosphaeria fusca]
MAETKISEYVTLVSNDGYEFKILRSAACVAGTIRKAMDPASGFKEAIESRMTFENLNGLVLEQVCLYLYYHQKHAEARDVPDPDVPQELLLELLMAAEYLQV